MFNLTKQHKPQLCKQTSKSNPFFPLPANSRVVRTTLGLSIDEAGPYVCVDTTECGINNGIYGIRGCPLRLVFQFSFSWFLPPFEPFGATLTLIPSNL